MRLVLENAGLSFWPTLSLVIFFATTVGVLLWLFRPGSSAFYRSLGRLALEDPGEPRRAPAADSHIPKPSPEE